QRLRRHDQSRGHARESPQGADIPLPDRRARLLGNARKALPLGRETTKRTELRQLASYASMRLLAYVRERRIDNDAQMNRLIVAAMRASGIGSRARLRSSLIPR